MVLLVTHSRAIFVPLVIKLARLSMRYVVSWIEIISLIYLAFFLLTLNVDPSVK